MSAAFKGVLFSILAFFLFSAGDTALKALSTTYGAMVSALYTDLLIIVLYLGLAAGARGVRVELRARRKGLQLVRGLCLTGLFILFLYGIEYMTLTAAYALIFATPFFTAILGAVFLKERVSFREWVCIAVGFIGVLAILRPGLVPFSLPSLAVLAAAFLMAVANIMIKPMEKTESWMSFQFYASLCTIPVVAPYIWQQGEFPVPGLQDAGLFILAALAMGFGGAAIVKAFALAPSATAAAFHYTQIVYGAIFGYIFFRDVPDLWTGMGAVLIIGSGFVLLFGVRRANSDHDNTDKGSGGISPHSYER